MLDVARGATDLTRRGPWSRALLGVSVATLLGAGVLAAGQVPTRAPRAALTPLIELSGVEPGTTARAALVVHLPPGYHAQSNAPKDASAIPTRLTFEPPDGVRVLEEVFPPTVNIPIVGFPDPQPVFDKDFTVGVQFELAPTLQPGPLVVPGHFRYQACNDRQCLIPVTLETAWTLAVVAPGTPVHPQEADQFQGIAFDSGQPPPAPTSQDRRASTPAPPAGPSTGLSGTAQLDEFTVAATTGGYQGTNEFLKFVHDAESGTGSQGWFEGRGPLAILLLVFVGGLALNLTPCVLPMIPINLAIIGAGARSARKSRGFVLGATYGAAMALVYGILGLVVILTAGSFGTINASPWFNLAIALVFVVLGLAMFDVITIDLSRFSSGIRFNSESRGSLWLAFAMGGVAALLAGACVAPVVVQVVLFASNLYATGTKIALALPFVLGLGMAVPWPVAGAGLALLPKPGRWMERVKYAFGVFILATAAYYAYVAYGLFANRWVDASAVQASVDEQLQSGWQGSLAAGLEEAARDHKPVLIDLWATWCKNCLVMDRTTLVDPAVTSALAGYVKIKVQAEDPSRPPAKELMQRFNASGLPTYVILEPRSSQRSAVSKPPS